MVLTANNLLNIQTTLCRKTGEREVPRVLFVFLKVVLILDFMWHSYCLPHVSDKVLKCLALFY
jgi:hypothetical protein